MIVPHSSSVVVVGRYPMPAAVDSSGMDSEMYKQKREKKLILIIESENN